MMKGTWSRIVTDDVLCRSSQAVSAIYDRLLIFGGELEPRQPVESTIQIVNLTLDPATVDRVPDLDIVPLSRVSSPSTTIGTSMWLFSGRGGLDMKPLEEDGGLWQFRFGSSKWEFVEHKSYDSLYPKGRSYHCLTSDGSKNIYMHAGCPESGRLSDFWAFNIETRIWSELASAPGPARGGASIAYHEGKIYRMNGFDGNTEQGGALDVFEIAKGAWTTISYKADGQEGPEARSVASLLTVHVNGKTSLVTMFGERDPSALGHAGAGKMLSDVWAWDVELGQWKKVEVGEDMPEPRGWFDADVSASRDEGNDSIIVHGGLSESNTRLGDVWKLNFS